MQIKEYLSEKVLCLKKAGAEVISLTAVTMHACHLCMLIMEH